MANLPEFETNVYGMVRMLKSADLRLMSILKCEGVYPSLTGVNPRFECNIVFSQTWTIPVHFEIS
jgi:hypothetical protein